MDALIQIIVFLILLLLGYVFGRRSEAKHYRSIKLRENNNKHIIVTTERLPEAGFLNHDFDLVNGNVVISVDYFKVVAGGLRKIIGGRIRAYESLLDRARREAILRMQDDASALGAKTIINVKFETSRISGNAGNGVGSIEVLAYGTALIPKASS